MQEVTIARTAGRVPRTLRRLVDKPAMTNAQRARSEVGWGIAALVGLVVIGLIALGVYVFTPGQYRVVAQFSEAGQVRVGDSVRVAGVPVGTVGSITLAGDHVDVTMSVRDGVHIGAESTADVKMLTVVGGNFVDITSIGAQPLGEHPIPADRTTIPYSLMETFQLAKPKLSRIDAAPLRELLVQTQDGLTKSPGALKRDVATLGSMLANLNKRQDDFGAMLNLAAQYAGELDVNGDIITAVIRNLSTFIAELQSVGVRVVSGVAALGEMLERVKGLAVEYADDIDPLVRRVDAIGREAGPALARYTPMIDSARALIKRLEGMVGPDGSIKVDASKMVLAADYCVPLPGMGC